ncbi:MAG: 50S ribosomal protein L21 [Actinomycetota bacterium]
MYAVIRSGGRQYKVASGDVIEVNRLEASEGQEVSFDAVLVVDDASIKARPDDLSGVKVRARVVGHKRGEKIRVFNYHRKTGWKKTRGHRQELTAVEITEITTPQPKTEART